MKKFSLHLLAVTGSFLSVLLVPSVQAEPSVTMRVEAAPKEIYIGDPVEVRIQVAYSSSVVPSSFAPVSPLGEFDVLNVRSHEPEPADAGKMTQKHELFVTTFSTGAQTVPPLTLAFKLPDGTPAEVKTEALTIQVKSLLAEKGDEGGLRPLKGFFNFRSYLWVWILLGAGALAGVIFLVTRRRRKNGVLGHDGPPKPPEELAWEAIHALEDSDLLSKGLIKDYYSRLTGLLRAYLEGRFAITAMERTTAELLVEFRNLNLSFEMTGLLRDVFESGDLVKFAKMTPEEDEIEKDLNRVKQFVSQTTPERVIKEEKIPV